MHICTGIKNRAFAEVGVSRFTFPFLYLPFRCFLYNFFLLLASVHLANAVAMQNVSELKKNVCQRAVPKNICATKNNNRNAKVYIFCYNIAWQFWFVVGVSISLGFSSRGLIIILCLPSERCSSPFFALSSAKFCLNGHNSKKNILHLKNIKKKTHKYLCIKNHGVAAGAAAAG